MASCTEVVPHARLFMRPLQRHLLHFWRPASRNLEAKIPINKFLLGHLNWWQKKENLLQGKPFTPLKNSKVLTKDASKSGFGGHLNSEIFQRQWTKQESKLHINSLEVETVYKSVQHFLPQLKGQNVLIRSDNITVVQYVNKQGGTRSPRLCYQHGTYGTCQ